MNTRRQYKPGPSQIARYKANTMSQTKDLNNLTLEYQTVFGKHFTNTTNPVDFPPVVKYPPDDGYPTPEQIKAMADEIVYRGGKKLSEVTKAAGTALKFDTDKLPLHLLSTEAMNQTAAVLKFGAEKYAEHNWRKGFAWSRPLSAAMRHITAFNAGEDTDPESGLSHLAHAACCIMFLLEFEKTHQDLDDRYKPVVHTIS
jgi:hypothetical protein